MNVLRVAILLILNLQMTNYARVGVQKSGISIKIHLENIV